jgi:hypothetical protein
MLLLVTSKGGGEARREVWLIGFKRDGLGSMKILMESLMTLGTIGSGVDYSLKKIVHGVRIGLLDGFPLAGSTVYYVPEVDMLCLFPVEEYDRKQKKKQKKRPKCVHPWYTFTDILSLDSVGAEEGSTV